MQLSIGTFFVLFFALVVASIASFQLGRFVQPWWWHNQDESFKDSCRASSFFSKSSDDTSATTASTMDESPSPPVRSVLPEWKDESFYQEIQQLQRLERQEQNLARIHAKEVLIHPAMVAHPNPRVVALVSSHPSSQSTLSEEDVLYQIQRHNTVETILVVHSDSICKMTVNYKDNDQNNIYGNAPHCYHGDRTKAYATIFQSNINTTIDVIIVLDPNDDDVDKNTNDEKLSFVRSTSADLKDYISSDGVLVVPVTVSGTTTTNDYFYHPQSQEEEEDEDEDDEDEEEDEEVYHSHLNILDTLAMNLQNTGGFARVLTYAMKPELLQSFRPQHDYFNTHKKQQPRIIANRSTPKFAVKNTNTNKQQHVLVAFQSTSGVARWHLHEAHVNLELHRRQVFATNNYKHNVYDIMEQSLLDSTLLQPIEFPSKSIALDYCYRHKRKEESKDNDEDDDDEEESDDEEDDEDEEEDDHDHERYICNDYDGGFNPETPNIKKTQLKVQKSLVGEHAGRGVFALSDIPQLSFIVLEASVVPVRADWKSFEIMEELHEESALYYELNGKVLYYYFDGYGFIDEPFGMPQYTVDSSLSTFINHGCNGSFNLAEASEWHEFTIDVDSPNLRPPKGQDWYKEFGVYNPFEDRRITHHQILSLNEQPIKAGEELLDNYLTFAGAGEFFRENVLQLRNECSGALGDVEKYQDGMRGGGKTNDTEKNGREMPMTTLHSSEVKADAAAEVNAEETITSSESN